MTKTLIRLVTRLAAPSLVVLGLLAVAPLAQASDASLKQAMKAYESRLTTDIGYLSNFSVPGRSGASTVLHKLSKIGNDLAAATRTAKGQQASTNTGRKARTQLLSALSDATIAAGDARACTLAVRSGNRSAAKRDQAHEQTEINKAITLFESAGKLLHLF